MGWEGIAEGIPVAITNITWWPIDPSAQECDDDPVKEVPARDTAEPLRLRCYIKCFFLALFVGWILGLAIVCFYVPKLTLDIDAMIGPCPF